MTLADLKDWATIIGIVVTVVLAPKAILEYSKQNVLERLKLFQEMRRRFESESITRVRNALDPGGNEAIASVTKNQKVDFLAFCEDLALMVNSGMMRPEIALYWFGFYAVLADEEPAFWTDMDRDSPYWSVFRNFSQKMRQSQDNMDSISHKILRI